MGLSLPIIYIAGVPRSGTSWVGQVLNSSPQVTYRFQPFFSYEFKGRINEDSSAEEFLEIFNQIRNTETPFLVQLDKIMSGQYPTFTKAENPDVLVFKENRYQSLVPQALRKVENLGLLAVVRNPCAVLNSWRKNNKEFPDGYDFRLEWRHGLCKNKGPEDCFGYYKWKEAANQYLDLREQLPDRVKILRYEEAVFNPMLVFQDVFEFFGLSFTEQSADFITNSTTNHSESYYAVYKNTSVVNKWREELNQEIVNEICADLAGTRLMQFISD